MNVFNKTIIPLMLVGYDMIIANSAIYLIFSIMHAHGITEQLNSLLINNCKHQQKFLFYQVRSPSPGATISHTNPMRQPLHVSFYF